MLFWELLIQLRTGFLTIRVDKFLVDGKVFYSSIVGKFGLTNFEDKKVPENFNKYLLEVLVKLKLGKKSRRLSAVDEGELKDNGENDS